MFVSKSMWCCLLQRAVLEPAMQGKDLIARAKTGTGKTLAFGIPIINNILRENEENKSGRCVLSIRVRLVRFTLVSAFIF